MTSLSAVWLHRYSRGRRVLLAGGFAVSAFATTSPAVAQPSFEGTMSTAAASTESSSSARVITGANWEASDPPPTGYRVVKAFRRNLVVEGAGLLVLAYAPSAFAAAASSKNAALWMPVIGPAVRLVQGVPSERSAFDLSDLFRGALAFDALLQLASATMIAYGFLVPRPFLVRDEARLHLAPIGLVGGRVGLSVVGLW